MNIEIHLNNGEVLVENVSNYDKERILLDLNTTSVSHVIIGDLIANKHTITLVRPEVQNG